MARNRNYDLADLGVNVNPQDKEIDILEKIKERITILQQNIALEKYRGRISTTTDTLQNDEADLIKLQMLQEEYTRKVTPKYTDADIQRNSGASAPPESIYQPEYNDSDLQKSSKPSAPPQTIYQKSTHSFVAQGVAEQQRKAYQLLFNSNRYLTQLRQKNEDYLKIKGVTPYDTSPSKVMEAIQSELGELNIAKDYVPKEYQSLIAEKQVYLQHQLREFKEQKSTEEAVQTNQEDFVNALKKVFADTCARNDISVPSSLQTELARSISMVDTSAIFSVKNPEQLEKFLKQQTPQIQNEIQKMLLQSKVQIQTLQEKFPQENAVLAFNIANKLLSSQAGNIEKVKSTFQQINESIKKEIFTSQKESTKGDKQAQLKQLQKDLEDIEQNIKNGEIKDEQALKNALTIPLNKVENAAWSQQAQQRTPLKSKVSKAAMNVMQKFDIPEITVVDVFSSQTKTKEITTDRLRDYFDKEKIPTNSAFIMTKEDSKHGLNINVVINDKKGNAKSFNFTLDRVEGLGWMGLNHKVTHAGQKLDAEHFKQHPRDLDGLLFKVVEGLKEGKLVDKDTKLHVITNAESMAFRRVKEPKAPELEKRQEATAQRTSQPGKRHSP